MSLHRVAMDTQQKATQIIVNLDEDHDLFWIAKEGLKVYPVHTCSPPRVARDWHCPCGGELNCRVLDP